MRRLGWTEIQATAWERMGRVDYVDATVEINSATGLVWIEADIVGANAPWWYAFFADVPRVKRVAGWCCRRTRLCGRGACDWRRWATRR
jgi:hypothetical protein